MCQYPCQYLPVLIPWSRVNQKAHLLLVGQSQSVQDLASLGLRVVSKHPSTLGPLGGNLKVHPLNHLPVGLSSTWLQWELAWRCTLSPLCA